MTSTCFVCNKKKATHLRSFTQLTTPPASREDAAPLCDACDEHWTFTLLSIARTELLTSTGKAPECTQRPNLNQQH